MVKLLIVMLNGVYNVLSDRKVLKIYKRLWLFLE